MTDLSVPVSNYLKLFMAAFGPADHEGHHWYQGPCDVPDDLDWHSLNRRCPVPAPRPGYENVLHPDVVERLREILRKGVRPDNDDGYDHLSFGHMLTEGLDQSLTTKVAPPAGRLYVLEAQGPYQYAMYGQTGNVVPRINTHRRDAARHGFGLLNLWVSPVLSNARKAEWVALNLGRTLHGRQHDGERFYELPYGKALTIARVAAEAWAPDGPQDGGSTRR
ncbi:hypothetical protein [Actinacidiphila paucisporea]|uniref:GIY-YIG nuclease family protein n=1 Tax=Actinacidiphila paucisporea TaxID=310782 RepID=A0A1M6YL13_9ACTN|nr:hypothetical protein [Actinacidiphila paucisporea]SHL18937.1 hypothetical protein SAMN05216499_10329 [Actinacidiphila paucisporea]